jgi:hypothetical protein
MTTRTITSLYDTYDDAAQTVRELEAANVPPVNISMMASNADNRYPPTDPRIANRPAVLERVHRSEPS